MPASTSPNAPAPPSGAAVTLDNIAEVFACGLDAAGKPSFRDGYRYYADDVEFHDSVQKTSGKAAFEGVADRLAGRCSELTMEVHDAAQRDNVLFVQWTMHMRWWNTPLTPLHGTSKLTLNEAGLIREQRDYYDLWGDTFDGVPIFGKLYRRVLTRYFG